MNAEDLDKERKQLEIISRVLANTVISQLTTAGCNKYELVEFVNLVLSAVMDRGFRNDDQDAKGKKHEPSSDRQPVIYRVETISRGRHRIHSERVTLDPLKSIDKVHLESWMKDDAIQKSFSRDLLEQLVEHMPASKEWIYQKYFIVRDESNSPIGMVSLFNIDRKCRQAEMAKLLGKPASRGKGYAKESSCVLLGYAFQRLKLKRVYLRTSGFNLYNIILNEKLGFNFEGILRNSAIIGEKTADVVWMSILAREYFQRYHLIRDSESNN